MDYLKSRLSPDIALPAYTALGGKGLNYSDPAHWKQFLVNWEQPWLWICLASVIFNPVFWNTVARNGEFAFMFLRCEASAAEMDSVQVLWLGGRMSL
jgi:hypothetical protein